MKVEHSIVINLPIEEIFAYISDLENMVDWSGTMIALRRISPGEMHVGATVRSTTRFLGRWLDMTFEVVEYELNRSLTIKSISGLSPCLFCYQFEPVEDGRTHVSQKAVIHVTEGFQGLEEPVLINLVCRQLQHDLLTLKDMLEGSTLTYRNTG